MIEMKRRNPATVSPAETGGDVLFLGNDGVYYTKDSNGVTNTLGNGIVSIVLVGVVGLVKTYRITYSSGSTYDFSITDGRGISSVTPPASPGQPGATDVYTITYSDGSTSTFSVYNGINGAGLAAVNNPTSVNAGNTATKGTRTAYYALEDHQHGVSTGVAVGLNGGSTSTEGSTTTLARSDHTHAISNGGTPSTISPGATAAQGTSTSLARADHTHGITTGSAVGLNGGTASAEGTGTSFARNDHTHAISNGGTPGSVGTANSAGTSTSLARSDHIHAHGDQNGGTLHSAATTASNGFMSASDKTKLDGIATGAQVNTVTSVFGRTGAVVAQQSDYDAFFTTPSEASAAAPVQSVTASLGLKSPGSTGAVSISNRFSDTFFHVGDYGTLTDGSDAATVSAAQATANRQAIQAAIDAASSAVGKKPGGYVIIPPGTYHIDATLTINTSSVILMGAGRHGNSDVGSQTGTGTTLFWNNVASGATVSMIAVTSVQGASNPAVKGAGVTNMSIQCAGNVGIGLLVKSVHWCNFENLYIINATSEGLATECFITGTDLGEAADVTKCTFNNIGIRMLEVADTAVGFSLDGASNANTSNSTFRNLAVSCKGAQLAMDIRNTDTNRFYDVVINQSNGGTVQPIVLRGAATAGLESRGNMFFGLATGGGSTGVRGIKSEGTDTAGVTQPAMNNRIWGYSIENGEPAPLVGTGSVLSYSLVGGAAALSKSAVVANATTTTETIIARWLLPENFFYPSADIVVEARGQVSSTGTLIYRIRVGTLGTTADAVAATFTTSAAGVANAHTGVRAMVECLTAGAAGTVTASGFANLASAILSPATAAFAAATVNTTARLYVSISVQQSMAQTYTTRLSKIVRED